MSKCNDFNCPNMNSRGYCNVTACTNPNKYNTNFKKRSNYISTNYW